MRIGKTGLPHIKRTTAKGRVYYYFNTGKRDESGKIVFVPLPEPRSPDFGAKYAALIGHRNRGLGAPVMTAAKLVQMFQTSQHWRDKLSDGTRRVYGIYLAQFVDDFGPAEPGKLERSDIAFAMDQRAATPGAANMFIRTIRSLYKWARLRGHVDNDPCRDIELFDSGEHQPWPDDLLRAALTSDDERVRLSVHLLYYTAQRIGDVCKLRWSAIKDGVVYIQQQKTGKELSIPLHIALRAELDRTPKKTMTIIPGQNGRPLSEQRLREVLQEWAADNGHKIVPHGLRKNAVNALLESGCSVAQTAAISGQSFAIVEQYAKRRNQRTLASAAIHLWEGNKR